MGKKDKVQLPYVMNIILPLDGLEGVPPGKTAQNITTDWLLQSIINLGEESKGFQLNHQLQFRGIRKLIDKAIEEKADTISFEPEDWRFLRRCYETVKTPPKANEVIGRVNDLMLQCIANRDKAMSDQDKEPFSSQN